MSFTFRSLFLWTACSLSLSSCNKLVETSPPSYAIDAATVFANDGNAERAMQGIYIQIMDNARGSYNGNIPVYTGLSGDELEPALPPLNIDEDSFYMNQLTAGNRLNENQYTGSYRIIYSINSLLDGLAGPNRLSVTKNTELTGEAKLVRAFIYFYLVNLYGDVPLITSTLYTTTALQPRAPAADVYQQVISDLQDAQRSLPAAYITNDRTRPNQAVALALLARVWLYRGEWVSAASAAGQVITDTRYQLEPDLGKVFLNGSREAIWQWQPVYDRQQPTSVPVQMATAEGGLFLPKNDSAVPAYKMQDGLLNSLEPGDQRAGVWIKKVVINGSEYVYPSKYRQAVWTDVDPEYEMVLRLGELYLVRAEARVQMGDRTGAVADLNAVRQRAGLAAVAVNENDLVDAIMRERRVELMAEWGHRWLDLKRTGLANGVLEGKVGWKATDTLYPIPTSERLANPHLTQNAGY